MANNPWDQEVVNLNERPLSSDMNQYGSYAAAALRELFLNMMASESNSVLYNDANTTWPRPAGAAFIGSGFRARSLFSPAMQITLDPGLGFFNDNIANSQSVGGVSGVNDLSVLKPLSLTATETINVPAADPTNARIDIVEIKFDRRLIDSTQRDVLNPTTGIFAASAVNKTITYNQNGRSTVNGTGSINYKTGTPSASPSAPATDAGYVKIAEVDVIANATSVTSIRDLRIMLGPGGMLPFTARLNLFAPSGGTRPSLIHHVTPPGVRVGLFQFGNGRYEHQWIIQAGGMPNGLGTPRAVLQVDQAGASGAWMPQWLFPQSWGATTVAAGMFALNTPPGFTMATGQPIWVSTNAALWQVATGGANGNWGNPADITISGWISSGV